MKLERFNPLLRLWERYEYFAFFVLVPLTLFLIYLIPQEIKESYFILFPENPNLYSTFLNNYAHSDASHLAGNLFTYLVIMFLIFNVEVCRSLFRRMALIIFIILPIVLSLSDIYLSKIIHSSLPTLGFSGVVAGWVGYFAYSAYNHIKRLHNISLNMNFLCLVFLINASAVALSYGELLLAFVSLVSSIILAYLNRKGLLALVRVLVPFLRTGGDERMVKFYKNVVFLLSIFFVFSLFALVPRTPRMDSAIVNTTAHYIGYVFGLFVPTAVETLLPKREILKLRVTPITGT